MEKLSEKELALVEILHVFVKEAKEELETPSNNNLNMLNTGVLSGIALCKYLGLLNIQNKELNLSIEFLIEAEEIPLLVQSIFPNFKRDEININKPNNINN